MQRTTLFAAAVAAALTLAACEPAGTTAAPAKTVTVTPTPSKAVTTTPKAAAPPTKTRVAKPSRIRVPAVVGHNHQKAQNEMQAHGLFMLAETDATGQGRMLLWDRNWVVVRQTPPAGTIVKPGTTITLYSKKIGE
ncbi:PASTA domain-containing protein [Actinomadura darangshiensis]|uniref:PASTA domain-containing protein n=1 Tax=Actinomadura darangshiensis TaxID=705336 RepID=A0A4R5BSR7_9ACTN|nr:PASTA domain-containing protein [Actinomadura darangshiensis]TDD88320.1 PASTA domain-containing protein [Actinomadura darangshiensis]